jgi:hypothetical protein
MVCLWYWIHKEQWAQLEIKNIIAIANNFFQKYGYSFQFVW